MLIFLLVMTLYITLPILFSGYLFGIFLFQAGSMKYADLQKLLGLFFRVAVLWAYIESVAAGNPSLAIVSLFSLSGHYMVSAAIPCFSLFIMTIILAALIHPWDSTNFPGFFEHFTPDHASNAQKEEGERYFYDEKNLQRHSYVPEYPQFSGI